MAEKQGELFPEDKKPKSTKRKRRKSNDLSIKDRAKTKTQRKQQADVVTEQEKFRESEREYWKKKNQEDFGNLKIEEMDPRMRESYKRNRGNPEFNKEMEAFGRAKKRDNLTNDDIIERLKRNKDLLQIGEAVVQTGRNALSIGSGLWKTYRALNSLR
tara:strand:+ start:351 stop:824 length:474 start_codon:yes stop_codon:yes gene_type:complete